MKTQNHSPFEPESADLLIKGGLVLFVIITVSLWSSPLSFSSTSATLSLLAFLFGQLIELRKIAGEWKSSFATIAMTFAVSLIVFIPYKDPAYSLQERLDLWPLIYAIISTVIIMLMYRKRVSIRLDEGTTILHSIVLMYLVLSIFPSSTKLHVFMIVPFSFSILNGLTHTELSRVNRIILSNISNLALLCLNAFYVFRVIIVDPIEVLISKHDYSRAYVVFIDYFLLGAAGPYLMTSLVLFMGYFPMKKKHGSGRWWTEMKEQYRTINDMHVERFSDQQVSRKKVISIILVAGGFLAMNYQMNWVQPLTATWLAILSYPLMNLLLKQK